MSKRARLKFDLVLFLTGEGAWGLAYVFDSNWWYLAGLALSTVGTVWTMWRLGRER